MDTNQDLPTLIEQLVSVYSILPEENRIVLVKAFIEAELLIRNSPEEAESELSLDQLLRNYERTTNLVDAIAFEPLLSCYHQDPAFTLKRLRSSGLRPEKIRDIKAALDAATVSPQLHTDITDRRLTVGDVAEIGQTAHKLGKEDLTLPQQRRLINAGRKPILEHKESHPTQPLCTTRARKAIATAVRTTCPNRVKEPTIKTPRSDYGVRVTKHTITLSAPETVISALTQRLTDHATPYFSLFTPDAAAVNPNALKEKEPPHTNPTIAPDTLTPRERNQAEGFALLHALVAGCEALTSTPWDQDLAATPDTKPQPQAAPTQSPKLSRHQRRKARKRKAHAAAG